MNPLGSWYFLLAVCFLSLGALVRYSFLKRTGNGNRLLRVWIAVRHIVEGIPLLVVLVGGAVLATNQSRGADEGDAQNSAVVEPVILRASIGLAVVNILAAQNASLFLNHSNDVFSKGEPGHTDAAGCFALVRP